MAKTASCSLPLLILAITFLLTVSFTRATAASKVQCLGSISECLESNEFEMSSETHRRILAAAQYISYGALQANRVPCTQRGSSYYNCLPGASANPYARGCSAITRCSRY